jgi:hypothetical protein
LLLPNLPTFADAFIQFLQVHRSRSLGEEVAVKGFGVGFDAHLIRWAIKINFGGHPHKECEAYLE